MKLPIFSHTFVFGVAFIPAILVLWPTSANAQTASAPASAAIESPGAPHLLPHDTLLYARFDNVDELREDFAESSLGRMLADPKMKPLAGDVFQTLSELFDNIGQQVGINLDELLAIPSGQVAAAAFPRIVTDEELKRIDEDTKEDDSDEAIRRRIDQKRKAQTAMAGLFIIDAGKNVDQLLDLIVRILQRPIDQGYVRREQNIGSETLIRLMPPRPGRPEIEYFEKDNCVVLGIGHNTAADALERWLGRSKEPTFADSTDFSAVMARCLGAEDTRPQLTFYADPYHLVERLMKRGGSAALVWPIFEDLGIAKIRGIGGSVFRGGDTFDDISHLHVLIDPPRDGIFGVLRPEVVDTVPPAMVPADVTTYTTIAWNFEAAFDNLSKIIDRFQGEGTAKRIFEQDVKGKIDLDVRAEVLGNITGRYVGFSWIEPPARINSQARVHAFEVVDPVKAEESLKKLLSKVAPNMLPVMVGTHRLYSSQAGGKNFSKQLRRPEPSAMVLGKWLLVGDSRQLMERAVRAEGGAMQSLISVPEYDFVSSELGGKLDGEKPFMVSYLRGSDMFRMLYQLADSDDSKSFLRVAGEKNPVAAKFAELLRRNELPPFEEFEKYFAPSGSFGYDEASGIHIGSFTLKAD